jgi:hypothetical protein
VFGWGGLGFGLGEHSAVSTQQKQQQKYFTAEPPRTQRKSKLKNRYSVAKITNNKLHFLIIFRYWFIIKR